MLNEPVDQAKKIFVCSPYGGLESNLKAARAICLRITNRGHIPFAAHLLFTQFLDDKDPEQREFGISAGLEFMPACDEVWMFIHDGKSAGMLIEEERARELDKKVVYYDGADAI